MCKHLGIPRSLVYYKPKGRKIDTALETAVQDIFSKSRRNYGARKIKVELKKIGIICSRRRIREVMKKYCLVSSYTVKLYKLHKSKANNAPDANIVDREFDNRTLCEVIVSDLTYVKVGNKWNYICALLDLYNREIIGFSVGRYKDAGLVYDAFMRVRVPLNRIRIFHTDRGSEFNNKMITEALEAFGIKRSLSRKGNPYDNAVAESFYNILKTEFVQGRKFETLEELNMELFDYVNWYNKKRIHGTLGYMTPFEHKAANY